MYFACRYNKLIYMSDTTELEKQDRTIRRTLASVFVPIFLILFIIIYFRNNSVDFIEKEYLKIHNSSYSGVITNLYEEKNSGPVRKILINDKIELSVPFYIHEKLNLGDSIVKKKESDIQLYIKKNGIIIKDDINTHYRKKYYEKLDKQ